MDSVLNPYAPGAGTQPPELAGREGLRETVRVALARVRIGMPAKSLMMIGLRGVGKTVLLDRLRDDAERAGMQTMRVEAPENRSLPSVLLPQFRKALMRISRNAQAKDFAVRGLKAIAGFVNALKFKYKDLEVGFDYDPEPGLADFGDLESDLQDLFEAAGAASQKAGTAIVICIDELQYVKEDELAVLITVLHRVAQRRLPVVLLGAGLPQLRGRMGKAKSYAERLFDFREIGPLEVSAAKDAIVKPARDRGVRVDEDALTRIVQVTQGYPYFLQEWGKHAWDVAEQSPITLADVERASGDAIVELDESFFRVRFDRLQPAARRYLRAMAELGVGTHRSGEVAAILNRDVKSLAQTRSKLIEVGMIWSPNHGEAAFTVPMFDEFMRRIMPGDDWS